LLPETGSIFGRKSKPFSHYLYRSDPAVQAEQFHDPTDKATLIELRGTSSGGTIGLQTVVPPSTHPRGEAIRFERGFDRAPANVAADMLITAVKRVAAAALLARHWPGKGSRHRAFLALAGGLARAGWGLDDAKTFHRAIYNCLWSGDARTDNADSEVQSSFEKYAAHDETTGVPTLVEIIDKKVIDTTFRWLGIDHVGRRDYLWNDTGNADRLADLFGHELACCAERDGYYVWNGKRWQFDDFVEIEKRAELTMLKCFDEAKYISDAERRKAFLKFVNTSLSRKALANMIHLAKKKVRQVSTNDFDRNPWLLNTEGGTVELKTAKLRPHRREDLLSKMIPFRYDPQC